MPEIQVDAEAFQATDTRAHGGVLLPPCRARAMRSLQPFSIATQVVSGSRWTPVGYQPDTTYNWRHASLVSGAFRDAARALLTMVSADRARSARG